MRFQSLRAEVCLSFLLAWVLWQVSLAYSAATLAPIELKDAFPGMKFDRPLWLEESPDGTGRLFVLQQEGKILVFSKDRRAAPKTFLDLTDRKPMVQNEEGLLGMAFHPGFASNQLCYLFYVQQSPKRNVLSEVRVAKNDPNTLDLASERVLLEIPQPYWNHKGGTIAFGPDGYLYYSVGDGGFGGDPHNVGQSGHHLLGKILRLDVNSRTGKLPYGVPKDNPFVGRDQKGNPKADPFDTLPEGVRPEIWAYGLRNVWRMSFDRETGELWAGDVGQEKWEEVDLITKGGNYGWNLRERFHEYKKKQKARGETIDPVIEYPHNAGMAAEAKFPTHTPGVSITGGYVYRGKKLPELKGVYIYGDFQMGTIWGLRHAGGKVVEHGELSKANALRTIASFAEDQSGELYVLSFDGHIYALTPPGK